MKLKRARTGCVGNRKRKLSILDDELQILARLKNRRLLRLIEHQLANPGFEKLVLDDATGPSIRHAQDRTLASLHRGKEFLVRFGFLHLAEEELNGSKVIHFMKNLPQNPDLLQFFFRHQ